tara:strand:- start:6688 stop:7107 length:420 start_codon:yes stop_codon:yes gene_type:complete
MSNFFVPDEIYKKRIKVCKGCQFYSSVLGNCRVCGCFMKLKARIASMGCPKNIWTMHDFVENLEQIKTNEIPKALIKEVMLIYPDIKKGKAKNQEQKRKVIELYNIIFGANFDPRTNCSGCVNTCYTGIMKIAKENENL